jgi:hypothetical protein
LAAACDQLIAVFVTRLKTARRRLPPMS